MHRIAARAGGWNFDTDGVILIEQTPAPIVVITAADTDIQTFAATSEALSADAPAIRVVNLLQLQQPLSIDTYAETVLSYAKVIILRLLGGRAYWSYGLEVVKEVAKVNNTALFVLPGDYRIDLDLVSHSTQALTEVNQLWQYFTEGGLNNYLNAVYYVSNLCLGTNFDYQPPQTIPQIGIYHHQSQQILTTDANVGILFYRSHYLAGNTAPIDSMCQVLTERKLTPIPIYLSSLSDQEIQKQLGAIVESYQIQLLLNSTSFAITKLDGNSQPNFWQQLNLPVLQIIFSSSTEAEWQTQSRGLGPRDVAMNVALPEVDGKIITRAVSFKSIQVWHDALETEVVVYQPQRDRTVWVADLARNWLRLRQTPVQQRRIALILANYPNRDGRIANGVGLDTPASCIAILQALKLAGYQVEEIPQSGDELIQLLTAGITNDRENNELRKVYQWLSASDYRDYFNSLPHSVQQEVTSRWGAVPEEDLPIPGIQWGNIFVSVQPSRGYDLDPSLNYHAPDLEPTHQYLAYYHWLRSQFQAHAVIHVGKHGNLEWLPGKSVALSNTCYPEIALSTLPHIYPFIVNDPGEGSQAKRRGAAVIIDHLTPPLTRAELYDDLLQLETLIDEYYEAQSLDPARLEIISENIIRLVESTRLSEDLNTDLDRQNLAQFLTLADGYLCELKEAQIRDGLHIFGCCPQGEQLRDLVVAIARSSHQNQSGLTAALAADLGLDFRPLQISLGEQFDLKATDWDNLPPNIQTKLQSARTYGDVVEILETIAAQLVEQIINGNQCLVQLPQTQTQLHWIRQHLLPCLQKTSEEIDYLLAALDGCYVPSGAAGAPTRGRADVLPTGKNFYSVDIRAIPTPTAWKVGSEAAEQLVERYAQENGEYPRTLAISVWGTSTMRTGGDDVAEIMALMGVRPVWDMASKRVVDFEILPPEILQRPRVDVTVRVSGFFRDAFPNLLDLLNKITAAIANLDETESFNPLAAQVARDRKTYQIQGIDPQAAQYRLFGSKPGAYGAGLQGLIEAQNWQDEGDLAQAYINWSCYAYTGDGEAVAAPQAFSERLKELQIVLHNQDNREHDLLDSDDYYQFQGGLTVATRSLTGKNPQVYFGDNSIPDAPKVRLLSEEIARVYRSRVVNPKWIAGVMRHGYKGAFELAATVDYLFAYSATTGCVSDWMYGGVAQAYLFDPKVQQFVLDKNPWALRDMAERLLEAHQRQLWQSADAETVEQLKAIANAAEAKIESVGFSKNE